MKIHKDDGNARESFCGPCYACSWVLIHSLPSKVHDDIFSERSPRRARNHCGGVCVFCCLDKTDLMQMWLRKHISRGSRSTGVWLWSSSDFSVLKNSPTCCERIADYGCTIIGCAGFILFACLLRWSFMLMLCWCPTGRWQSTTSKWGVSSCETFKGVCVHVFVWVFMACGEHEGCPWRVWLFIQMSTHPPTVSLWSDSQSGCVCVCVCASSLSRGSRVAELVAVNTLTRGHIKPG